VVALTQGSIFHGPLSFFPGARIWITARTESSQGGEVGDKLMEQTMRSDVVKSEQRLPRERHGDAKHRGGSWTAENLFATAHD